MYHGHYKNSQQHDSDNNQKSVRFSTSGALR